MIIGVSSYSYSRLVRSGAMQQIEVIRAAKEAGPEIYRSLSTIAKPDGISLEEYARSAP